MQKGMTPKERLVAAIKREPVDYVPCSPYFNPLRPVQRVNYGYNFPWPEGNLEAMLDYNVNVLGVDPIVAFGMGYTADERVTVRKWVEGDILHKVHETPAGPLHAAVKVNELWPHGNDIPLYTDFIAHFTEPWVKTMADIERLRYLLIRSNKASVLAASKEQFERVSSLARKYNLPMFSSIGTGLTGALQLFGAEALCMAIVDQPAMVHEYLELEHKGNMIVLEQALGHGVDIVIRNGFYETADFYGAHTLRELLKDRLQEEFKFVHDADKVAVYTQNTGVMPLLDYLDELDFDCVNKLEISPECADIKVIANKLGSKKSFWTGPSNTFHMWSDTETIRQAVRDVFEVFGKRGLIITGSPSSHSTTPWENSLAMIDEWKRLR